MVFTCAARQADAMLVAPAVKLIMAGTRLADIRPSSVTAAPLALGSMTPIASPGAARGRELAADDVGADQQPLVGQRAGDRILDRDAALAVALGRVNDGVEHRAVDRRGAEHQIRHDLVERRASGLAARLTLELIRHGQGDRVQDGDAHLGEPAPANLLAGKAGEDRRLQPVDLHRHDLRAGLLGDEAGAVIDLHQASGDRQAALREDDEALPSPHGVDQRSRGQRTRRVQRHGAGELEERLHPPALGDAMIDGEDPDALSRIDKASGASRKLT